MACIKPWPRMGLSTYIVFMQGASKPVSHISRTRTSFSGSAGLRARLASVSRRRLLPICCCHSTGSEAEPDITILMAPLSSSSECQFGRSFMISSYSFTQIRRLIQTAIALPPSPSSLRSKWVTKSWAICAERLSAPTSASTVVHLALNFSFSASVSSSTMASISASRTGFSSSFNSMRAIRLS